MAPQHALGKGQALAYLLPPSSSMAPTAHHVLLLWLCQAHCGPRALVTLAQIWVRRPSHLLLPKHPRLLALFLQR